MLLPRPDTKDRKIMASQKILSLSGNDNIAVALQHIERDAELSQSGLIARGPIQSGHKITVSPIASGQKVIKYGRVIGVATQDIHRGDHVHVHNVAMTSFRCDENYGQSAQDTNILPLSERATFEGYRRANGEIGTRNYVGEAGERIFNAILKSASGQNTFRGTGVGDAEFAPWQTYAQM
jgi:altronate dehydratase